MEMENVTTKKHPSLPSNYVSILDLQECWLKKKQQEKEEAERKEQQKREKEEEAERKKREQQRLQKEREPVVVIRTHRYGRRVQYRPLTGTDSRSNSRWIARKSDGNGENADLMNGKSEELKEEKRKWKKQNHKEEKKKEKQVEEESESSEVKKSAIESECDEEKGIMKGNPNVEEEEEKNAKGNPNSEKELNEKFPIESGLNEGKNVDSKLEEAKGKIGGFDVKSGDGRQSWRIRTVNKGRGYQRWRRGNVEEEEKKKEKEESNDSEATKSTIDAEKDGKKNATIFHVKKSAIEMKTLHSENVGEGKKESGELGNSDEAKKSAIENELDDGNVGSAMGEIEEKFGGLSVKHGNGKQNWGRRFKRLDEGFGRYQSQRRGNSEYYFGGGRLHGFPPRNGFRARNLEQNKMVWVKKNGNVGGESET